MTDRAGKEAAAPAKLPPFTRAMASRLVKLSLQCVGREYPNKLAVVLSDDKDVQPPRTVHPAFFGCFDWHSAVHGHWAMARVLGRFPDLPEAARLTKALNGSLTSGRLAGELLTFKAQPLLERPYGWAWLLRLVAELHTLAGKDARGWRQELRPLERLLAARTIDYLKRLSVPVRAGTHHSTAFALAHVLDHARISGDAALAGAVEQAARRFYLKDRDCPLSYEPSGEDFVSPCLAEADLMRRVLDRKELSAWLDGFMPTLRNNGLGGTLAPPQVRDLKDPKIGHLIGLDFQRAWAMRGLAAALGEADPRTAALEGSAAAHAVHGMKLMDDSGYGGAHWLASFAIYLLSGAGL